VSTITPATLEAFRDHGRLRSSLEDQLDEARATLEALERAGISLAEVTDRLLEDGVDRFKAALDTLLGALQR
jgi:transaldolase/glucose-6-phosphate isomerase